MNVKRVTVAGVVIQSRRQLDVDAIGESKSRACLPRQHEGVSCRNFLSCTVRARRWGRSDRIFRIYVVINELRKVYEDVELQLEGFRRMGYGSLTFLTIPFLAVGLNRFASSAADVEGKCMLPLLREAFRIDIVIPHHRRVNERIWHSATGKLEVRETGVTEICLTHKDSVVVFREWSVAGVS